MVRPVTLTPAEEAIIRAMRRGSVVVALTKNEADALDYALGNSLDNGADKDVFVDGRARDACWRGRQKIRTARWMP